jgi:hypothetical protein
MTDLHETCHGYGIGDRDARLVVRHLFAGSAETQSLRERAALASARPVLVP